MKLLKIALGLSLALYVACVGLLAALRAVRFNQGLSMPEMFYGPAITIVSGWVILGIFHVLFGHKKNVKS